MAIVKSAIIASAATMPPASTRPNIVSKIVLVDRMGSEAGQGKGASFTIREGDYYAGEQKRATVMSVWQQNVPPLDSTSRKPQYIQDQFCFSIHTPASGASRETSSSIIFSKNSPQSPVYAYNLGDKADNLFGRGSRKCLSAYGAEGCYAYVGDKGAFVFSIFNETSDLLFATAIYRILGKVLPIKGVTEVLIPHALVLQSADMREVYVVASNEAFVFSFEEKATITCTNDSFFQQTTFRLADTLRGFCVTAALSGGLSFLLDLPFDKTPLRPPYGGSGQNQ